MFNIIWKKPDDSYAVTISADQTNGYPIGGTVTEQQTSQIPTLVDDTDNPGKQKIIMVEQTQDVQVQGIVYENSAAHAVKLQTPDVNGNSIIPADWVVFLTDVDPTQYFNAPPPAPPQS